MSQTLTIGVLGFGHLGQWHAQKYKANPSVKKVIVFDIDSDRQALAESKGFLNESTSEALLKQCDGVSICVPTTLHASLCQQAIEQGVPVLVEKPFTGELAAAQKLTALSEQNNVPIQVGAIERFNPAVIAAKNYIDKPGFIEIHRMGAFSKRSYDVGVVQDIMIHDLDLLHCFIKHPVIDVRAVGIPVITDKIDICNVRVEYEGGCVANLTASRTSFKKQRKLRFFQHDSYLGVDCEEKQVEFVKRLAPPVDSQWPVVEAEPIEVQNLDPLQAEIDAFIHLLNGGPNLVPPQDFLPALELAERIQTLAETSTAQWKK